MRGYKKAVQDTLFLIHWIKHNQKTTSLRAGQTEKITGKRVFRTAFFQRRSGSVTVEASLVLPLFIFALLHLAGILEVFGDYSSIQAAVKETAFQAATNAYLQERVQKNLPGYPENVVTAITVRSGVMKRAGLIRDLNLNYSRILEEDSMIDVIAVYPVESRFPIAAIRKFRLVNRCRIRAFTGFINETAGEAESEEELVYVTDSGSVYHRSRECRHLQLSVQMAECSDIGELRNAQGAKYRVCELCGDREFGDIVFLTDYGDRYHTTSGCRGLKRTIQIILLSQTDGRMPCRTCGDG